MESQETAKLTAGTIMEVLGIEYEELTAERVVATMPVDRRHHQPFGILHGGASVVLAETVASAGATLGAGPGRLAVGQEINANHIRPKKSGTVRAVGTPVHTGKTSAVWEVRITDEHEKLICISRCTLALIHHRPEE